MGKLGVRASENSRLNLNGLEGDRRTGRCLYPLKVALSRIKMHEKTLPAAFILYPICKSFSP